MLLGINLGDRAFLSADTRATNSVTKEKKDNIQKIEFLPNLIIAAAGSARLATEILFAIRNSKIPLPISAKIFRENFNFIIGQILGKENSKKVSSSCPLKPAIIVFNAYDGKKIRMWAIYIRFIIGTRIEYQIREYFINEGEYVIAGAIGEGNPIKISKIPKSSTKFLSQADNLRPTFLDYEFVSNIILEKTKENSLFSVGGKILIVKTFVDSNNKFKYIGMRGRRSIIHKEDEYQDVSFITDFDLKSNRFFLRDSRNDGMIITHINNKEPGVMPTSNYDSCPKNSGLPDKFYIEFSKYEFSANMDLEL